MDSRAHTHTSAAGWDKGHCMLYCPPVSQTDWSSYPQSLVIVFTPVGARCTCVVPAQVGHLLWLQFDNYSPRVLATLDGPVNQRLLINHPLLPLAIACNWRTMSTIFQVLKSHSTTEVSEILTITSHPLRIMIELQLCELPFSSLNFALNCY